MELVPSTPATEGGGGSKAPSLAHKSFRARVERRS